MPKVGIEPTYPRVHDFESCASACSATSASSQSIHAFPHAGQDLDLLIHINNSLVLIK